jgi:hypothetical protein
MTRFVVALKRRNPLSVLSEGRVGRSRGSGGKLTDHFSDRIPTFTAELVSTWAVFERSSEWSGVRGVRVRRVTRGTPLPADASSDSPQGVSIVSGFCDEEVPPNPTQERSCRMRSP